MPRASQQTIAWCREDGAYELAVAGRIERRFRQGDDDTWRAWLAAATAFTFRGAAGRVNAYREARARGEGYWYAYRPGGGRARKRYLGPAARVSLALLEEVAADLAGGADPTPPPLPTADPGADRALPATKFAPPQAPPALVIREPLLAALDAASALPLTLVAAPAGWGKTTALATWARRHPARVAWLALEAADDAPVRFWSAVVAALRTRAPGVGATALALLRAPRPAPLPAVVAALINDLVAVRAGGSFALILDDYHLIADSATRASVAYLADHLPGGLRLVLAGRADPDLPLARLRARGQLAELRAADLAFSADETATFLGGALDAPLADDAVAALAARTEGWAAGVQLAAIVLRGQADPTAWLARFTGGHRFLLDYIEEEVLARLPPTTRDFLLRAAVLARLDAASCTAVTGGAASGALLAALERDNLFLVPLDEERHWYRLHDLFREALLARAARETGLLADAHRRAARWHADHGDGREAIGHALAGADHEFAADLIAREAPRLWLAGEARAVLGWLGALPGDLLLRHARLALDTALRFAESIYHTPGEARAAAHRDVERFLGSLEGEAGRVGAGRDPGEEAALIRRRIGLLRAFLAAQTLLAGGDRAGLAALVAETAEGAAREEVRWRTIGVGLRFWLHHSLEAAGMRLLPELLAFRDEATAAGEGQAALTATVWLVSIRTGAGQLRLAERECRAGLALASRGDIQTASAGYPHLYLAELYYAWNRPDEAEAALRALFAVARTWQQTDQLVYALGYRARLALLRGAPADADAALGEAEAIARREGAVYHAAFVAAERARYWLATGDLASAERWAGRVAFDPATQIVYELPAFLASVRVALALGRHAGALAALDAAAAPLDRLAEAWFAVEHLALRLLALHGAGERAAARAVAARLLALTEPEGWLRSFLDEGAPMEAALAALVAGPGDEAEDTPPLPRAHLAQILAAFDERRAGRAPGPASVATRNTPAPVEPLTRREREVLAHLADGASNQEIADALALSVNTVKRHVGGLLAKLGATSRTGAVARARQAALLP